MRKLWQVLQLVPSLSELSWPILLANLIEGNLKPGQKVVVIEDLVSTGGSSLKAVEAVRNAGAEVVGMLAIFTYQFPLAEENFKKAGVKLLTLGNYTAMLDAALKINYIKEADLETLKATNESLISTLDEVMNIQREGREKRREAEVELRNMENELKAKLLEIRG